jgi:hypothetical protein
LDCLSGSKTHVIVDSAKPTAAQVGELRHNKLGARKPDDQIHEIVRLLPALAAPFDAVHDFA